jgi:hypothetical protein
MLLALVLLFTVISLGSFATSRAKAKPIECVFCECATAGNPDGCWGEGKEPACVFAQGCMNMN